MMSGQYWPEGDEVYHAELTVPTLLIHGMHDRFVPVEEDQRMAEVKKPLQSLGAVILHHLIILIVFLDTLATEELKLLNPELLFICPSLNRITVKVIKNCCPAIEAVK